MNVVANFFQQKIQNNTIENWLISIAIIVLVLIIGRLVYPLLSKLLTKLTSRTKSGFDDLLVKKLETPVIFCIILIGLGYAVERLHFTVYVDKIIGRGFIFLIAMMFTWVAVGIARAIIEQYIKPGEGRSDIDAQMLTLIKRGTALLLWTIGLIVGLNNAGFDVAGLIAGLGIGGLALALAAQDTVKNIFGGIMIFLDKPFILGDGIKIGNFEGTVHRIGVRSTRIRTGEGRIVTIPNAQFSDSPIENITMEPSRRISSVIGLVYETSAEQLEQAIHILREIGTTTPSILANDSVIYFETFNAYSLDIKFQYFIKKESDIQQTQTEINKQILTRFKEAGLKFAYPTRTLYTKQNDAGKTGEGDTQKN